MEIEVLVFFLLFSWIKNLDLYCLFLVICVVKQSGDMIGLWSLKIWVVCCSNCSPERGSSAVQEVKGGASFGRIYTS